MGQERLDDFCWYDGVGCNKADAEEYQVLISWAMRARGTNPLAFDRLTEWLLDDVQWGAERLAENERILMRDIIGRFREQNAVLRARLQALQPSGVVNEAVFAALDRFDDELTGECWEERLRAPVKKAFGDFSALKERELREQFAGGITGPAGTDTVDVYGYINFLKDCDAAVQWALFMPKVVEEQQRGFRVASFEYKRMPAMRFIGFEEETCEDKALRADKMKELDALSEYRTSLENDVLFMHHYGLGVDVGPWHGVWGRFMRAGTPVPEGFLYFDFVPQPEGVAGPPYVSQFAYATFEGDCEAMHAREGYDSDAMYDVTRNIMLGQSVPIPYPDKYWTAEVFPEGCDQPSTAYMFSAILDEMPGAQGDGK